MSVAGRRAGMTDGTRSGLWSHMVKAIDVLRPGLVFIENVGGLFSAEADSRVEPCDYHLGDADGGGHTVLLRALDSVLGTLSSLGYDAQWVALRAADVGAPHGRLRVFIAAHPAGHPWRLRDGDGGATTDPCGSRSGGRAEGPSSPRGDDATVGSDPRGDRGRDDHGLTLLPTPMVGSSSPAAHGQISGDYRRRMDEALGQMPSALIPTPSVADGMGGHERRGGARGDELLLKGLAKEGHLDRFGPYAPAIARWEQILGRPAPAPTEPGKTRPRLAARFVEWLMGLPDGHVTGVPGLTRNQQLKALGNGVVPLQAATALRHLLSIGETS